MRSYVVYYIVGMNNQVFEYVMFSVFLDTSCFYIFVLRTIKTMKCSRYTESPYWKLVVP